MIPDVQQSDRLKVREETIKLPLDHGVAFTDAAFEAWPIQHFDIAVAIADQSGGLQLQRRLGDTGSAHTQHVGDQFLRHAQLVGRQAVQAQQQPTTQLLVDRVVAIADRRLCHLC